MEVRQAAGVTGDYLAFDDTGACRLALRCGALALHHATGQRAGRLTLAVGDLARDDGRVVALDLLR
jgi:hypothetical protein